jgi:phosphinothricin acetyltransferase
MLRRRAGIARLHAMNADLERALEDVAAARRELLAVAGAASADDLARGRPGGWTLGRVLHHIIESEAIYARLLAHQCGRAAPALDTAVPADGADAAAKLAATRAAVETLADGIDDETLYRLVRFGHEEYSPLSVLENIAAHDRDHRGQIADVMSAADIAPRIAPAPDGVLIRVATIDDLPRLTEIYNHYVVATPTTFDLEPFSVEQRREWFGRYAATGRYRLLVAEDASGILGYTSSSPFHPRRAYDTTVETTILCAPEAVGRGIGRRLYAALFDALRHEDVHLVLALITLPNEASCALHERFGYTRATVLREVGRKFGQYWDVAWYQRRFGE